MTVLYMLMFVHLSIGVYCTFEGGNDYVKVSNVFYGWYILDRIYLIILYKFLLILKRAQIMEDQNYTSIE